MGATGKLRSHFPTSEAGYPCTSLKELTMSDPFLAEIRTFSFNFPPRNCALCNGQILSIAQNQALFSLLGTTYGGNGQTTFALPDLRSRSAMHTGGGPGPGLPS